MMVDHHHVGVHCPTTRFHYKALFIKRAIVARAVIVRAGDQRPDGAVFRHAAAVADIAVLRFAGPAAQINQIAERLHVQLAAGHRLLFQTFRAKIVGSPFQQCGFAFVIQRPRHARQVAAVKLILKRFRTGGNDRLFPARSTGAR